MIILKNNIFIKHTYFYTFLFFWEGSPAKNTTNKNIYKQDFYLNLIFQTLIKNKYVTYIGSKPVADFVDSPCSSILL